MVLSQVQQADDLMVKLLLLDIYSNITNLTNDGTISGTAGDDFGLVFFFVLEIQSYKHVYNAGDILSTANPVDSLV